MLHSTAPKLSQYKFVFWQWQSEVARDKQFEHKINFKTCKQGKCARLAITTTEIRSVMSFNFFLETRDNELFEVTALKIPTICSPLPNKINVTDFPRLDGLEFADQFDDNNSIEVLIGSDNYWDIVSGETVKGKNGPTAVSSKFGWLLSGPLNDQTASNTVITNVIVTGENDQMMFNSRKQLSIFQTSTTSELIICAKPSGSFGRHNQSESKSHALRHKQKLTHSST